jgi:hypothetical protein
MPTIAFSVRPLPRNKSPDARLVNRRQRYRRMLTIDPLPPLPNVRYQVTNLHTFA